MGFINRLFGKKKDEEEDRYAPFFSGRYEIDKSDWVDVFSACLGKMVIVQEAVSELVIQERDWNVDFDRGIIAFGHDEFPVQFLGTESAHSSTWMWGWENINGFDERFLTLSNFARKAGEEWGLEPLVTARFELDEIYSGQNMAIAACGISDRKLCFYRGVHDDGAVLVAFSGVPDEVFAPVGIHKFINTVTLTIQHFELNHKILVESLLLWNGTGYEWHQDTIIAHFEQELKIEFESSEGVCRLKEMKSYK